MGGGSDCWLRAACHRLVQNPITEDDFKWILHRNCEGTEQLRLEG